MSCVEAEGCASNICYDILLETRAVVVVGGGGGGGCGGHTDLSKCLLHPPSSPPYFVQTLPPCGYFRHYSLFIYLFIFVEGVGGWRSNVSHLDIWI